MQSLFFLLRRTLKNILKDLVHHPAKLVAYLFLVLIFLFAILSNVIFGGGESAPQQFSDPRVLRAIFLGLMLLFTVTGALGGMNQNNSGNGFFRMSDVNFLFGAPLSPRRILVFALLRSTASTLLLSIFILCYAPMLRQSFGFSTGDTLLLMAGYLLTLLISQMLSLFGYIVTNGAPLRAQEGRGGFSRTTLWRGGVVVLTAGYAAGVLLSAASMPGGFQVENLLAALTGPAAEWYPFAGWSTAAVFRLVAGDALGALPFLALIVVGFGAVLLGFLRFQPDYYEDVLGSAEKLFSVREAQKAGRIFETGSGKAPRVKAGETGIGRGRGASAFFFKQLREMRRRTRIPYVDIFTVIMLAVLILLPILMSNGADDGLSPGIAFGGATCACIYLQFFSSSMGSWGRELTKPYLYLVPASPMAKLLWGSATSLLKPVIDAAVIFTIAGLAGDARASVVVVCALAYISFGAIFTSSNILSQRVLGQMTNKGMIMVLYMLMLMLIILPGVAAGIAVTAVWSLPMTFFVIAVVVWNLLAAVGIYAICRSTLHSMEAA